MSRRAPHAHTATCWGEILWDMFPDGRKLGGAPSNVAVHLAALRQPVHLVSRVGTDDLGHEARETLRQRNVDTTLVQLDPQRPTGIVGVTLHDGHARYSLEPDRAWEHIHCPPETARHLANADLLCFGTLSQRSPRGRESLAAALAAVPPSCIRLVDPNLRPRHIDFDLLLWSLQHADAVKINDDEARIIEGHFGVKDATTWLHHDLGVRWVALTRGARGSRLSTTDHHHDHPGFPVSGGDSVGAGDSFTAVFGHALLENTPLPAMNTAANQYAAFVASKRGATPTVPTPVLSTTLALLAGEHTLGS